MLFTKFAETLIGAGQPIVLPPESEAVDFEAELAFVIGRPVRRSSDLGAVAGYTLANDVSMRDYQYRTHQWLVGKAWASSTPLGPFLVTPDEVGDPHALDISLELNGERMQASNTSRFIFDIPTLIATISEVVPLAPGDVVLTGTPEGVGYRRDPQVLLQGRRPRRGGDRERRAAREPRRRRVITVRQPRRGHRRSSAGEWPRRDAPLGRHCSVTRALPRILELLDEAGAAGDVLRRGPQRRAVPGRAARDRRRRSRGRLPRLDATSPGATSIPARSARRSSAAWRRSTRSACARSASGRPAAR